MPSLDKSPGDTLSLTGFAGNSPLNEPTEEFLPSIVMVPFFGTRPVQMILPERVPAAAGATVGGGGPGDGCASVFNAGATGFSIGGAGKLCCSTTVGWVVCGKLAGGVNWATATGCADSSAEALPG